jgi:hypothetical protein
MTDCQAGPKQWAALRGFVKDNYDEGYAACILELRARVEALTLLLKDEAECNNACIRNIAERLKKLEANSKPTPNPSQIRSSPDHFGQVNKMVPAGSLVGRVYDAMVLAAAGSEARAAIREVAEWLREECYPSSPSRLEREVGQ